VILPAWISKISAYLLNYPPIGKAVSSLLGLLEVPILQTVSFLDRHTRLDYFQDLMRLFTRFYGSRVIPLGISLQSTPSVGSTEEMLGIVRRVTGLAIGYCYCRSKHGNCENDVWTCIHVGTAESIKELEGKMPLRTTTVDEVEKILVKSNEAGLVHQLITGPIKDYFYVICNCCPCCCVMLRSTIGYGLGNTALASNFEAQTDMTSCDHCGQCADRCHFGARVIVERELEIHSSKCVGCGLCVNHCPLNAIVMVRRPQSSFKPMDPL